MKHIMWELGFRQHDLVRLPAGSRYLILATIDRLIRLSSTAGEPAPRKGLAKVIQLFPGQSEVRS